MKDATSTAENNTVLCLLFLQTCSIMSKWLTKLTAAYALLGLQW